jgi:hypothetical protein
MKRLSRQDYSSQTDIGSSVGSQPIVKDFHKPECYSLWQHRCSHKLESICFLFVLILPTKKDMFLELYQIVAMVAAILFLTIRKLDKLSG